jgi:hypothetical protein
LTTISKIKIKLGPIEIEYKGSETFLKEELPQLLSAVSDLYAKSHSSINDSPTNPIKDATSPDDLKKPPLEATTGSIAAKLNVKSGPELILAAAARLTLVLGTPKFSRQQISDEMKTATAYYKATYLSNLSMSIASLVKGKKLNEPTTGNYALTAASLKELEQRIV